MVLISDFYEKKYILKSAM